MARPAESPEYHQLVGTRATRANNEPSPHTAGRPSCPSYLSPVAKKEFRRIVKILTARGTLTPGDGPAIELYCQSYARYRACIVEIETLGDFVDVQYTGADSAVFTKRAVNPASKLATQLANSLRAQLIQLGATPSAREKAKQTKPDPKKEFPVGSAGWLAQQEKEKGKERQTEILL
jgi:P27 family predicted phage terminase small subunit